MPKKFDNSFVLFINDRKEPGSNQPDRRGKLTVNGEEYDLSGWIKTNERGETYLSGRVSEPYAKQSQSQESAASDDAPW